MNTILKRSNRYIKFGLSNVLQIMSANAISRHMFFGRGFYLEIEIRITFLYDKQFQEMTLFSKELIELYIIRLQERFKNYVCKYNFCSDASFKRKIFFKVKISLTLYMRSNFNNEHHFSKN